MGKWGKFDEYLHVAVKSSSSTVLGRQQTPNVPTGSR